MADILTTLKTEHEELLNLLEQLDDTSDRAVKARPELLEKIEASLMPHAKWEEAVFYPAFAERASHDELKIHAEAVEEHRAVETSVLPDLKSADVGSREFAGAAKVLSEMIQHHAREEEDELFPAFRKHFDADERAELDQNYAQWKESPAAGAILAHAKVSAGARAMLH